MVIRLRCKISQGLDRSPLPNHTPQPQDQSIIDAVFSFDLHLLLVDVVRVVSLLHECLIRQSKIIHRDERMTTVIDDSTYPRNRLVAAVAEVSSVGSNGVGFELDEVDETSPIFGEVGVTPRPRIVKIVLVYVVVEETGHERPD